MNITQRDTLRELLRRVDEVRGLADREEPAGAIDPEDSDALLATLGELVQELERSHRRLIGSEIQLHALREVASSMVGTLDVEETTRRITSFLCRGLGFEHGFLLLLDRESGVLHGTWTHRRGDREQSWPIRLPVVGESGAIARALWLNRTMVHQAAFGHRPALLPPGHTLDDVFEQLGALACVPLQRSHSVLAGEQHELCGARCPLGDAQVLAPPPGPAAESWSATLEERQRGCLGCDLMPLLGVIGMGRRQGAPAIGPGDRHQLESIALSVAPMVENARLTQDLRRSERFQNHLLHSMPSALVAVNMEGEILTFNRAAQELLGYGEAEVRHQPFGALLGPDGETILRETLDHAHEALRVETLLRAHDGTPVPVSLTTSLLRNDKRAIYGAIAAFVDLTPLKRAEEHARQLDRLAALGRFTSSVAHEIRNPLTGIGAGVQYLSRAIPSGDPQHENLQFILNEIRRLDGIVQDLFDVTHPRGLSLQPLPLEDTARRALLCVEALAEQRGVTCTLEAVPRTPPAAHDADQMQQVLINLIKNAVEACDTGGTVRIHIAPTTPAAVRRSRGGRAKSEVAAAAGARGDTGGVGLTAAPGVGVTVEDTGHGIPSETLKTIFEPFFTTKQGGTGLGLYITHDIVKRHGGTLTVHSEPGRGTRFTVELPVESNGGLQ